MNILYSQLKQAILLIVKLHKLDKLYYYSSQIKYYHNYLILSFIIGIFKMLSKADQYLQKIQNATQNIILFPHVNNQEKKPTVSLQCNIKLPSSHPFRSSHQIENNLSITHKITHQSLKQYPTTLQNEWPNSCIGLIICEHHQNNQIYYVYGTGTLIHSSIVLTSAQNVYCRRMNTQYVNIRFIVGVSGDKCCGIYDIKRVHYPKEYTMQEYDNYNFAVLQLYDDLSNSCGYVGWKTIKNIDADEKYTEYGYISGNKDGFFKLRERTINIIQQQDQGDFSESGVLIKENDHNKYYILGLQNLLRKYFLSESIRNIINQWTESTTIDLNNKDIGTEECKYLSQFNCRHLTVIGLGYNNIDTQGCKCLSQTNWTHLATINLWNNNINSQGCKYLSQANWAHFTAINIEYNNVSAEGCKYLTQANWTHLTQIYLSNNNIGAQGCKYLSQASWQHLTAIDLGNNKIGTQGCKYLSQTNWAYLITIDLAYNSISAQGCKYLSQSNWRYLTQVSLNRNNIDAQGCNYLSQANWTQLSTINLRNNNIEDIVYRLLLLQLYPINTIKI